MALSQRQRTTPPTLNGHIVLIDGSFCYASYSSVKLLAMVFSMIVLSSSTTAFTRPIVLLVDNHHKATSDNVITLDARTVLNQATTAPRLLRREMTRSTPLLGTVSSDDRSTPIRIALTREEGKNSKLRNAIQQVAAEISDKMEIYDLPCIAHAEGADYPRLRETLLMESWDYIAVTSPEAARVLASAWPFDATTINIPAVAAVGTATEQALCDANIAVSFCPSKATAETLVEELPLLTISAVDASTRSQLRVLYPASTKAAKTLSDGLTARGFDVTRLNTYDTVTSKWNAADRDVARTCQIVCFASPSAAKGWVSNMNDDVNRSDSEEEAAAAAVTTSVLAACIGETSAKACRKLGWTDPNIIAAAQPGLDGWVAAIVEALGSITKKENESNTAATI